MTVYAQENQQRERALLSNHADHAQAFGSEPVTAERPVHPFDALADAASEHGPELEQFWRVLGYAGAAAVSYLALVFCWNFVTRRSWEIAGGDTTMWFLFVAIGVCGLGMLVAIGVLLYSLAEQQRAMEEERR